MKRTLVTLLVAACAEPALLACPVCFQADDSATSRGVQAAVIVLFAVTTAVLSVCGIFVARFASRERRATHGATPTSVQPSKLAVEVESC